MTIENCYILLPERRVGRGDIVVDGGRIVEIREHDCEPLRLVMPGFVNCHGHTAMTLVRGLGGGLPLQRWLEEAIFPVEAKMTPQDVRAGAVWGIMEMLAGGTMCVADMYDFPSEMESALAESGMRGFTCRVGLNFVPGRLDECVKYAEEHPNSHLCIHSEYLTDEKFCRALAEANRRLKRPLHVHVSETKKEHGECIARHGKTPIAYLADTGILDFGGYAAHCVWCTDDDFRIMAEKGISLVHNPTSNMKLGSGFARIPRAMELGVNVALGTDGCASNDNLDMFEEMHLASLIHKGLAQDPTILPAWDVIEMATKNGAKALGLVDSGEIAVGKSADLCVVGLESFHLAPAIDIPNLVVNSMGADDVIMTIVGGEVVYEKGGANCGFPNWPAAVSAREGLLAADSRLGLTPPPKRRIYVATHNAHKLREIGQIFPSFEIVADDPDGVEENAPDFLGNAFIKVRAIAERHRGEWCMADDSGLEVAALGGAPGVRSARYAGEPSSTPANNALLLKNLSGVADRRANFTCAIALVGPDGREHSAVGKCFGRIAEAPSGAAGFGYDPLFVPDGHDKSFAELSADEKNAISHRGRALAKVREIVA